MTTVAVLADPPRPGLVLPAVAAGTPLSEAEAADLYSAMLGDVCRAVEDSGGELLVNYRGDDDLPADHRGEESAEAAVRATVKPALSDPDAARFEVQVGSTFAARAGNTATHLLENEDVATVAVVEPTAPFVGRGTVDSAAMKLRRHDAVLGPAPDGRVHYAGFGEPLDFEDAWAPPALETLTRRARDAGLEVDFLPMAPVVEGPRDLATAVSVLEARGEAGRNRPGRTAAFVEEHGLRAVEDDDGLRVVRE